MNRAATPNQLFVDVTHNAVLVPVCGALVPFHISMVKSVTKNDEDKSSYLRIIFHAPGGNFGGTKRDS